MKYIVLLRGINVGGNKKIAMAALRKLCLSLGFVQADTYLQSGNIILTSSQKMPTKKIAGDIQQAIAKHFSYQDIAALAMNKNELKKIIDNNPFRHHSLNLSHLHATLFFSPLTKISNLTIEKRHEEDYQLDKNVVYLYCPNGYGRTKLNNAFWEKTLQRQTSTRNWRTITHLMQRLID